MQLSEDKELPSPEYAWNLGAAAWEKFVESGADYYRHEIHAPALLAACDDVDGLRVLDVGCGQGFFTRLLARAGAAVTGIDLAENQLESARKHERDEPLGIEYRLLDAGRSGEAFAAGRFNMVTACMSLQDMSQPEKALAAASVVLEERGRLVFSVPHPFTDSPYRAWERDEDGNKLALKVDRYFDSGMRLLSWNMERLDYHWETPQNSLTLGQWSDLVAGAGFVIKRLSEPRPSADQVAARPELDDASRLPYFLIVDALKH